MESGSSMNNRLQKNLQVFGNNFWLPLSIAVVIVFGLVFGLLGDRPYAQSTSADIATLLKRPVVSAPAKINGQWVEIRLVHTVLTHSRISYLIHGSGNDQQIIQIISGMPWTACCTSAMALNEGHESGVVCEYTERPTG